jgi:hypothetical protein
VVRAHPTVPAEINQVAVRASFVLGLGSAGVLATLRAIIRPLRLSTAPHVLHS